MRMVIPDSRLNRAFGGWASDVNSLVDSLLGAATEASGRGSADFTPRMDIYEADDKYVLSLDLPGVKSEDVQIEVEDNNLVIYGTRHGVQESQGERFHRVERVFGEFRRSLRLPRGIAREQISADYHDGVLSVILPKNSEQAARKIQIRAQNAVGSETSAAATIDGGASQAEQPGGEPSSS